MLIKIGFNMDPFSMLLDPSLPLQLDAAYCYLSPVILNIQSQLEGKES